MHVRAHIPGQISGPLSSQAVPQLPALPQQNVSNIPFRRQSLGNPQTSWQMSPEIDSIRNCIFEKIVKICRQRSPTAEWEKLSIFARRLELILFQNSSSKEEYMNISILQQRLINIFQCLSPDKCFQRMGNIISSSSSSSVGTMVATPGMPQRSDTNSTASSLDNSIVGSNGSTALVANSAGMCNLIPTANVAVGGLQHNSFNPSDGVLSNGYQQSFPPIYGGSGNNIFSSSLGAPTHSSQMIPTPRFSNSRTLSIKTSSGGGFSNVDSVTASPSQQSLRCIGGQNSHIIQMISGQMVSGMRSDMHAKPSSYFFPDEVLNCGLGTVENNSQLMNGVAHSELYMNAPAYASSQMPLQQQQKQQQMMQNVDGCTTSITDISGPGNLFGPSGNMEGVNPLGLQPNFKADSPLWSHQQNVQLLQQASNIKSRFLDHSTKLNMAASQPTHNHLSQPQQLLQRVQQQQYSNCPHQSIVQLVQNHHPHKLQNQQNKQLSKNQSLRQCQLASNGQLTSTILGQVLSGHQVELHNEAVHHQMLDQYQFSDLQDQYHLASAAEVESKGVDMLSQSAGSRGLHSSITQVSRELQHGMQRQGQVARIQNGFPGLTVGKSEISAAPVVNQPSAEQLMHENFIQQVTGQDEGRGTYLAAERSVNGQAVPLESSVGLQGSIRTIGRSNIKIPQSRKKEIYDQQRWLLLLLHAKRCSSPDGKCLAKHCIRARNLWKHMEKCIDIHCKYTYCCQTKKLLNHFSKCGSTTCALCVHIRCWISQQKACAQRNLKNGTLKTTVVGTAKTTSKSVISAFETSDSMEPLLKRVKLDNSSPSGVLQEGDSKSASSSCMEESEERSLGTQQSELPVPAQSDTMEVKEESTVSAPNADPEKACKNNEHDTGKSGMSKSEIELQILNDSAADVKQYHFPTQTGVDHANQNIKQDTADHTGVTKSGKPKIKGVSLTELFTPEQVRQHVVGLRKWVGQSKAKAEKKQAMGHSMSENSCQLCAVERLTFEPPPIYCTKCGVRIKRHGMYYTGAVGDTRHYFCIPCHNEARGETVEVDGTAIAKARLDKKKNDEETEESWVQCDKCQAWQHQICALFNGKRNDGGQAEYTCPNCYIAEIGRGERQPLPQSTVLGAKDLPRTILSDHMEQWLFRKLKQERHERARAQSKSFDEVPGAEGLVIRVVSSVDKKVEVKQPFLEIFQEENYPSEFPYKSKVVLLFQKIEGVEVCLFGMYVQEFGSESQLPSQRCVYLSYLDSVKYFRPEVKTVTGEALRTFVYHEILIGYLEYCKKRGFTSCYIWACPPFKGEDYILYCHPEIQKTPKSDKLREWYLSMLRKAQKENIVVGLSNLYDHFFVPIGECKAKVTAARLPYFDGDYWPGAAEDIINQFRQEDGKKQQKKGTTKKTITKRQLKGAAQADLSSNASKDALLMRKLGETIYHMKEDFIMVHLQHTCTHCYQLMVSGRRWICSRNCKNFQLCDKCYEADQKLEERDRHPMNSKEKHILTSEDMRDVREATKDKDENLESEFFDTRQAFLGLCQGNHYQFDTLRRAKHSSMMVLYHLHNPTEPAYVTTCNICTRDIEAGQGWHCGTCPEFDVCNNCYQKDGGIGHPHKLTSPSTSDAQNKEARQERVLQLRKMLDLLVHASQCHLKAQCLNPNCHKVKGLFRHGYLCKTRASGGCQLCRRMWNLMKLHAQGCNKSECPVPRCKDLREHLRRSQQQSESRRRAAVMEMMRQRAAEAAGSTD